MSMSKTQENSFNTDNVLESYNVTVVFGMQYSSR